MASSVAAESILFIGAVIAATGFAGVLTAVTAGLATDLRADAQAEADASRADITIINDPARVTTSPNLVLYVKNTGSLSLDPSAMVILVDGALATAVTVDVLQSTDDTRLAPGDTAIVVLSQGVATGDHRVRVVSGPGAADDFAWSG